MVPRVWTLFTWYVKVKLDWKRNEVCFLEPFGHFRKGYDLQCFPDFWAGSPFFLEWPLWRWLLWGKLWSSSSGFSLNGHLEDISLTWLSVLVYFVVGFFSFILAEAVLIGNCQLFHFQLSCVQSCLPSGLSLCLSCPSISACPSWSHLLPKPCATSLFVAFCPRLSIFLIHTQSASKSYSSKCSVFIPSFLILLSLASCGPYILMPDDTGVTWL